MFKIEWGGCLQYWFIQWEMDSQIQRMKSSIANIHHNLKKLEGDNEETTKFHDNDENILPESIIHEDVYAPPDPTPKVTHSKPHIINTDIYTPSRHHLDDSQMKKALRYQSHSRSPSQTVKTQYIYDGSRVIYVPPSPREYTDYGQIVIQTKRSNNCSTERHTKSSRNFNPKHPSKIKREVYVDQQRFYPSTQPLGKSKNKNKKVKKYKVIEHEPVQIRPHVAEAFTQSEGVAHLQNQGAPATDQRMRQRVIRNAKIQCDLRKIPIKQPFLINLDGDTDSDFSDMAI